MKCVLLIIIKRLIVVVLDNSYNLFGFLFRSEFFFRTTQELKYFFFCRAKYNFFFQNLTLDYKKPNKLYEWSSTTTINLLIISNNTHFIFAYYFMAFISELPYR
jgi:hypothetical protein